MRRGDDGESATGMSHEASVAFELWAVVSNGPEQGHLLVCTFNVDLN